MDLKSKQENPQSFLLFDLWKAFSTCVYTLDPRNQCDNTAVNNAWYFLRGGGRKPHLTITFFNTVPF